MFGIDDLIGAGLQIINKFIPDADAKAKAEAEYRLAILQAAQDSDKAQSATNANEASNQSVFVAGWRPAIGWVCAIAVAYTYLFVPFFAAFCTMRGIPLPKLPIMDNNLWELMFGMLGLGTLRTFEKVKGVSK